MFVFSKMPLILTVFPGGFGNWCNTFTSSNVCVSQLHATKDTNVNQVEHEIINKFISPLRSKVKQGSSGLIKKANITGQATDALENISFSSFLNPRGFRSEVQLTFFGPGGIMSVSLNNSVRTAALSESVFFGV